MTHVVDGDTLDVNGVRVRMIGIDTPERGQRGYREAKALVNHFVGNQGVVVVNNDKGQLTDRYGRELGYVHRNDFDLGEVLLRWGLAEARHDSRDGYDAHPRETLYRKIDAATPDHSCVPSPKTPSPRPTTPTTTPGVYYANCAAVRAAGKAPLRSWEPGYNSRLDRDGDGVACE